MIGSPYAVYEYECNPSIGNNGDLSWLKSEINKRGIKFMLDFVPNHSVVDSPKAKENPEMYIRAPEGKEIEENKYTFGNSLSLVKDGEYFFAKYWAFLSNNALLLTNSFLLELSL